MAKQSSHFGYRNSRLDYSDQVAAAIKWRQRSSGGSDQVMPAIKWRPRSNGGSDQMAAADRRARKSAGMADLKDKFGANVLTQELDMTKPNS